MKLTKEKWLLSLSITIILSLVTLSSIYGYFIAPKGQTYTGIRSFVPADTFVYYSYLEQIRQGENALVNLYTTEITKPFYNIFWMSLGYFGRIDALSPPLIFFLAKIIFGVFFLITIYKIVSFFNFTNFSRLGLFLFTVGMGGLGPYYLLTNFNADELHTSMDLWVPELQPIIALISSPHILFSATLIFLVFYYGYRFIEERSYGYAGISGLLSLVLFQFHPYYIALVYSVLGTYFFVVLILQRKIDAKTLLALLLFGVLSSPSVFYHAYLLMNDEIFFERALRNILPLTSIWLILVAYSFFLPASLMGLYFFVVKKDFSRKNIFIVIWFIVQGLLIFSPVSFQRKLFHGWYVPMALLAWYGILNSVYWLRVNKGIHLKVSIVTVALYMVFTASTFFNIFRDFSLFTYSGTYAETFGLSSGIGFIFLPNERLATYEWLKENISPEDFIFNMSNIGYQLPAYTGRRVYVGHWSETIYAREKIDLVIKFYKDSTDEWRREFLLANNISYYWWEKLDSKLTNFNPDTADYLEEVYRNGEITIYRLIK